MLDLIQRETGKPFPEALEYAASFVGLSLDRPSHYDPAILRAAQDKREAASYQRDIEAQKEREAHTDYALKVWNQAEPADSKNSLVGVYLAGRGLSPPDGCKSIRYHPACPFKGQPAPAMLGLFLDAATGEPRAVHRTILLPDGTKRAKAYLGPVSGCVVPLTARAPSMLVAEGIENALAEMALGLETAAWAAGDATNLTNLPILDGVEHLTIAVDADRAGDKAAIALAERWRGAGRSVKFARPKKNSPTLRTL